MCSPQLPQAWQGHGQGRYTFERVARALLLHDVGIMLELFYASCVLAENTHCVEAGARLEAHTG